MAENDYNTMLANTRERLGQFCKDDGESMIPIDAHIVPAERN